jgi:hypothetical protein
MTIVLVVNAVLAALVFVVVVGPLVRSVTAERRDHTSLALRLRPAHRVESPQFVREDVLGA